MIIGRKRELNWLKKAYHSNNSEFVVVYGRRRVGKTYLVREYFKSLNSTMLHVTGTHHATTSTQITNFMEALSATFFEDIPLKVPRTWDKAFKLLNEQIIKHPNKKIVVFLDELPWLATRRSRLLQTIDYYWNHHWSGLKNVVFVACGSSASWLIKNILYDKGGLHNRVTFNIRLLPFNLLETFEFLKYKKIKLNHRQILSLYLALGGIPYYLNYVEKGLTAEQNIQNILFNPGAPLENEFEKLFKSLFENPKAYVEIVTLLAQCRSGMSKAEIETKAKHSSSGGRLAERIKDLCQAGFIEERTNWQNVSSFYYKLIDEFSLFHWYWIGNKKRKRFTKRHWIEQAKKPAYHAWSGYAFEGVCLKHTDQIIAALGITSGGIVDSWRYVSKNTDERGAQIDLLIDRDDDAITLCEIKCTAQPFTIDKRYAIELIRKLDQFKLKTKTKKQLFLALISANGVKPSQYVDDLIDQVITLNDLFKE